MRVLQVAMMVCTLFALSVGAAVDGPLFEASAHYLVGYEPIDVCIADFTGDGINDMACAQYNGDSLSVLIGKGGGDYEPVAFYPVGTYQYWIEAANIDDDSDIDLVVSTGNEVYTLDNDGSGVFGTAVLIVGLGNTPTKFKLADIEGDGDNELIVAHDDWIYDKLTVWENDGFGTFTMDNEYTVGVDQRVLAVADFDGDMSPDIAVGTAAPNYSVLLNDGSGGYALDDTYVLAAYPRGMCTGNFDGSLGIDLAITWYNNLGVFVNDATGAFSGGSVAGITSDGYGLSSADLDGVNGPDVVMVDDSVYVYYNNGSGSFTSTTHYFVGIESEALAIGKFDGDDYYDLAVAANPNDYEDEEAVGHIAILFNTQGNGLFMYSLQSDAGNHVMSLCHADFDDDGNMDVATLDYTDDSVFVLLGDGAGHFASASNRRYPIGNTPWEIIAAELDGLNTEDLVIGHSDGTQSTITVLLSNGDGTFAAPVTYTAGTRPKGVFAADFDGMNGLDIATTNTATQNISILLNDGSGGFGGPAYYASVAANSHSAIEGGDFNNDGNIDLVVPNTGNDCVQVYWGEGTGVFGANNNVATDLIYDPFQVCVDDLDGNGYDDIVVGSYDSSEVVVILGSGSGFEAPDYYYAGYEQYEIRVADFDTDGFKDFVVLNTESLNFSVFFGDGTGNFAAPKHYGIVSDDSEGLTVADFDNDGYPDVAVSNYNHDNVSVMLNRYTILTPVTEIVYGDPVPEKFMLAQNYPNPFNPATTIQYSLPHRAEVSICVYNLLGQRVKVFYEGVKAAGTHQVVWDGQNNSGRSVATGIYLYQLRAGDFVESRKMLLLK